MINQVDFERYGQALYETLYEVIITSAFVLLFGLIIGFLLFASEKDSLFKNNIYTRVFHRVLATINDIFRSIPFIILLILIFPFTRAIVGTIIGPKAAIPALIISATPFFARVVYMSLRDVPKGIIETTKSLGASFLRTVSIIFKEAKPSLVTGFTLTVVTLVGFVSSAAVIGAGGLAYLAYDIGKVGGNNFLLYTSTITILIIVFLVQIFGDLTARKIDKR